MKIKSLEVDNHPVLGTFVYSFEDDKTITLLVGKNGSGKTRFIELLHALLDKSFRVWEIPEWNGSDITRIKLSLELNAAEKSNLAHFKVESGEARPASLGSGDVYFEATQKTQGWNDIEVYMLNSDGGTYSKLPHEFKVALAADKPFAKALRLKCRYSSVQINFEYKPVTAFAEKVDDEEKIQTKSTSSIADEINKLLVSTYYKDSVDFKKKTESGELKQGEKYTGDFDRFVDAYNELFTNKEIIGVEVESGDNKIQILNKDTGIAFGIEGLSSGEQQVVYRVGYLLKNLNVKKGGVVFIDEPELSLHPEWQQGYIPFLQKIFGDSIQFVIATHSPYIVKSGIEDTDVSISKLTTEGGNLTDEKLHNTSKLGRATFAEVNYKAFDIPSEEFHTELYLALQRTYSPEKWDVNKKPSPWYVDGTPTSLDKVISTMAGVTNLPPWTDVNSGNACTETIMTFTRNIINHGDDAISRGRGRKYSPEELKQSIEEMLKLL